MKKYNILAIERQYASAGQKIGHLAAEKLGIPCYGKEILEIVTKEHGIDAEYIRHLEENATNSLLYNFAMAASSMRGNSFETPFPEQKLFYAESRVIKELSAKGDCVFIGRCAGGVLKENANVLRVFIYADREFRTKTAIENYQIPSTDVDTMLKRTDKRRSDFYNVYSDLQWGVPESYHLCLNSGLLGIEKCAEIICSFYQ